jgi:hypothetical protein
METLGYRSYNWQRDSQNLVANKSVGNVTVVTNASLAPATGIKTTSS